MACICLQMKVQELLKIYFGKKIPFIATISGSVGDLRLDLHLRLILVLPWYVIDFDESHLDPRFRNNLIISARYQLKSKIYKNQIR